jgi:galactofuranosylgalactofuranosylrhamnosyl-N-acetylglucosaminyl-diphospho-decaprenol beta-1,5/1,6-galactofuranosyltransferase
MSITEQRTDPAVAPAVDLNDAGLGLRVLQRVVMPMADDMDVLPLYVETDLDRGSNLAVLDASDFKEEEKKKKSQSSSVVNAAAGTAQSLIRGLGNPSGMGDLGNRRSALITGGERVSFGTYFNAFPASYWSRWSVIDEVVLRVKVTGECTVVVLRSNAKGHVHPVESIQVAEAGDLTIKLPLSTFADGGWYWFDIVAGPDGVTLESAEWAARTDRQQAGRVSIGITTYNRPDFCVAGLAVLSSATDVLDVVDKVYVIDQGTQKVADYEGYAEATAGIGDRLALINQGNLGGSGGFSRVMDETTLAGTSDYALLLDDDVVTEPESILRAVTFADLARKPTIVGGHMFSLYDRSVLHAFGETVAPYSWWWGPAPRTYHGHDFGRRSLRHTSWLHRRVDVEYNGWWMCLIPTAIIREIGLALPVFIKWDDAEYGIRARAAGFPTVSMPGVAVWHVPWQDKTDAVDWQAYHHLRNRLVAALLHSPYKRGGSLVSESSQHQVQHLLSMQYSTAKMRLMALEDILSGPEHMHQDLLTKPAELRQVRSNFSDAQGSKDVEAFPAAKRKKPPKRGKEPTSPSNPIDLAIKAAIGGLRQLRPVDPATKDRPQAVVASQDAHWWVLSPLDGAVVSAADGVTASWYKRDPELFRELMRASAVAHTRLYREWPALAERYQQAAAEFTSSEQWRRAFEA